PASTDTRRHGYHDLDAPNRPHRAHHRQAPAPARGGPSLPPLRHPAQPVQPLADLLLRARAADPQDPRPLGLASSLFGHHPRGGSAWPTTVRFDTSGSISGSRAPSVCARTPKDGSAICSRPAGGRSSAGTPTNTSR